MFSNTKSFGAEVTSGVYAAVVSAREKPREHFETGDFDRTLRFAAEAARAGDCVRARALLRESMVSNMENPQAYNLLGIIYEQEGDRSKAARFYRVAYYMDQTFLAASENLDRVGGFLYDGFRNVRWGFEEKEKKK